MCGRYYIDASEAKMASIISQAKHGEEIYGGEIYPGAAAPMIKKDGVVRGFWGYPSLGRRLINVRSETAAEKAFCRESFEKRRCVLPCSCYYEWDGDHRKTAFSYGAVTFMGGVYLTEDGEDYFAVLTAAAVGAAFQIHERMPLVLEEDMIAAWLGDVSFATNYMLRGYEETATGITV